MARKHGFQDWHEALAEALLMIRGIPVQHNAHTIRFGTFAESVGGGHYVSIEVSYHLGNTKEAPTEAAGIVERRRMAKVIEAWRRATAPDFESEDGTDG